MASQTNMKNNNLPRDEFKMNRSQQKQQKQKQRSKKKVKQDRKQKQKAPALPEIKKEDVSDNPMENIALLNNHPLIRKTTNEKTILEFKILVESYSLSTWKAKKIGINTISDDGIYEALDYMRKLVPRGLSIITFSRENETETAILLGFRKFSGMEDDSEEKIDLDRANHYFRNGSMADVTHFMDTNKSNGENAKWTLRTIFGKTWVFAGSKNTCKVYPLGLNPQHWYPVQSNNDYGNIIASEVYDMLETMDAKDLLDDFAHNIIQNSYVVLGELNHPQSEHVFPITELKIEHVALLGPNGIEVNPVVAFQLFDMFELPTVTHSLKPISALDDTLQEVLDDKTSEGRVLYLLQETEAGYGVLALLKHKSSFYVVGRRIRQNFWRMLVDPLVEFPGMSNHMVLALATKCQQTLKKKIPQLTFLPDCENKKGEWVKTGVDFVSWWANRYIKTLKLEDKMKLLDDAKSKYGTTYDTFFKALPLNEENVEEKVEKASQKIILLRGPSGCGKTYFAGLLVASLDLLNKTAVIVSADDYFETKGSYNSKEIQLAHKDCQRKALAALREGHIVIVANTNIQLWEMQAYVKMSQLFNVPVETVNVQSFNETDKTVDWLNKKNADVVAKILCARTKKRDTWRDEIPVGVITGQIKKFEACESIVDILLASVPRFIPSIPAKGVYNKGYAGFSHPVLMSWVQEAVQTLVETKKHPDIEACFDNALLRDNFVKHITLAFWKNFPKGFDQEAFMSQLRHLSLKDFKKIGIGMVDGKNGSRAYYIVVSSSRLQKIYKSFGIEDKFPTLHVTIGFRYSDVHGISKGVETLLKL